MFLRWTICDIFIHINSFPKIQQNETLTILLRFWEWIYVYENVMYGPSQCSTSSALFICMQSVKCSSFILRIVYTFHRTWLYLYWNIYQWVQSNFTLPQVLFNVKVAYSELQLNLMFNKWTILELQWMDEIQNSARIMKNAWTTAWNISLLFKRSPMV